MLRHGRLVEDDRLHRIDARRNEGGSNRTRLRLQVRMDQLCGDGVHVDDAIDAVIVFLQCNELADGAEIVAKVEIAGGLNPGENQRA